MAIQSFSLTPQRVGIIKGRILKHALPKIVLGTIGINDDFKPNTGDTVKYRRFLNKGNTAAQPNRFFHPILWRGIECFTNPQQPGLCRRFVQRAQ